MRRIPDKILGVNSCDAHPKWVGLNLLNDEKKGSRNISDSYLETAFNNRNDNGESNIKIKMDEKILLFNFTNNSNKTIKKRAKWIKLNKKYSEYEL